MPRKPKIEKHTITVIVNGAPINIILHPPTGNRTSWYAFWTGLVSSKSTGQQNLEDAIAVVERMVKNDGRRANLGDAVLTDGDFEAIQRAHFAKKTDPAAMKRSDTTLESVLEAISAFKKVSGLTQIAQATADDCAKFQVEALKLPNNWRREYPKKKEQAECLSANTVLKWSRSLRAAFDRANLNAGKKCVRGVVDEKKLLTSNPWTQFMWIGGRERPIRQFDADDLLSLLMFLETKHGGVSVAATAAKVFLWSCCRKQEVASLRWDQGRVVANDGRVDKARSSQFEDNQIKEVHFEVIGKWGVERWFRIPLPLFREMKGVAVEDNPFVFAAYSDQISRAHSDNPGCLKKIRDEFTPENFGRWVYERIKEWSEAHPQGRAYLHVFRKTALQLALDGEDDRDERVANDAGVSKEVLLGHYAKPKLWRKSNRTYRRILASLPSEVAQRYGHAEDERSKLERRLQAAVEAGEWGLVMALSSQLGKKDRPEVG